MLNTNPTHLTEGDFSRYLDGQADGEMTEHVSQCAQCQSQVESLRRVGAALHEVDALDRCPTTGTLLAFLEGDADGGLAARIGLHVEYCGHCQTTADHYRRFALAVQQENVLRPATFTAQTKRQQPANQPAFGMKAPKDMGGTYIYDFLRPTPPLATQPLVVRGDADTAWLVAGKHRVSYAVDRDHRPPQRFRLSGALAGPVAGPVAVHLWRADALVATTVAEDLSGLPATAADEERTLRFNFPDLEPGDYALSFALDGQDLRLPQVIPIGE